VGQPVLTAASDREFGTSRIRSTFVLERRFRAHVLHRDRILFDSRFHPAARSGGGPTLYVVVQGGFQIATGPELRGPLAYMLGDDEFERVTPASTTFRSWGAPSVTIELRLARGLARVPLGLAAGPLALGDGAWARCRALAEACSAGTPIEAPVRGLVADLAASGVIDPAVEASIPDVEPEGLVRLWSAMQPMYARHATAATVLELKRATGLSLRQLGRGLADLTRTFGLGDGFRDATRVLRLRAALVLLSAPTGTATAVARQVGYRSLDAMGRAFRDAGLPPPSTVQLEIRYRGDAGG